MQREQCHLALDEAAASIVQPDGATAEVLLLRQRYGQQFVEAFWESVASLSGRERNLLRYHFLFRLSIDQIGQMYGVHRATAARWVRAVQERLSESSRAGFHRRVLVGDESARSQLALLQS